MRIGLENYLKKIKTEISNLAKDINLHIQEAKQTSNSITPNKFTPRHIIIKFLTNNNSEKHLESSHRKTISYQ
jgi:uncharacterized protein YecA (UPF0149 family)